MTVKQTGTLSASMTRNVAASNRRLRVLLFTNSVSMGGMETHVILLARDLDRQKFEVFAICPEWTPTDALQSMLASAADACAVITPDRRWGTLRQIGETARFYRQLREWQIDVLHMHSTTYRGQLWALLAARLAGVRSIYVTEHLAPEAQLPPVQRWVRNLFSAAVTGIVCVSQKNYEARRAHVYTPARRTRVVNNGVDLNDFNPVPEETLAALRQQHDIPEHVPVVGTAVRFEPEKGLSYFIDAMPAIRAACPDAHFLMVGDGTLRAELEARVAQLGLKDCVHFTGFQGDPRPFVSLMDVFVLPVPVGSMSIGLLEAMAMERAVVMTFGGEGEAVVHGKSGFCATPRSPESIAEYVIQVLHDSGLKQALGHAARQRVATQFSTQNVTRELSALYLHARTE